MAKKGKGKVYAFGGIVVIIALAVLLVDPDDIGNLTQLTNNDLVFDILVPSSILPNDPDFLPFQITGYPLHAVECKVKQETKVYDVNGKLSRTEHSSGIQGSPQFELSLVTPANVGVSHYTVVPKIFCVVQDTFPPIFIKPSDLTVQVFAQTNPASEQRNLVFSQNLRTGQYSFPSPSNQVAEPALGVVTIRADDIESQFQNQNFNSQLEFKVFGTLKLSFDDLSIGDSTFEIPIGKDQLRTFYVQPVRTDQCQDRDLDGICDTADQCPDQPENFNNFEDTDGCPDNIPPPPPEPCTTGIGGTCPIINKTDCNADNRTWLDLPSGSTDYCTYGVIINGVLCKEFDASTPTGQSCVDPAPSGGSTTAQDLKTCDDRNGFFRLNPNNLSSTQLFTPSELSGKSVLELDTALCLLPIDTPNPPCTTSSCVVTDAKKGKIVTLVTITYVGGDTESSLASDLGTFSQGFVTNELFSTDSSGDIRTVASVKYETFYTRTTLDLAQDQKFVGGGVQFNPVLTIGGFKIQLQPVPATGSDQGLSGHPINELTNLYGFSLGHRVLTAQQIEADIPDQLSGTKKVSINMATDGIMRVQKDGISGTVNIQGEASTLTGLTVDIENEPTPCLFPKVFDPVTGICSEPVVTCTPPLVKDANGNCNPIPDDESYDSCHNDNNPPLELVGNRCQLQLFTGVGGTLTCTDDHTIHGNTFGCSPVYRDLFCNGTTQCGTPTPPVVCTPPKVYVLASDSCEEVEDICQNGQSSTAFDPCVERPTEEYCQSLGEVYKPTTNTCEEVTDQDCDDPLFVALFPELCEVPPPEPNTCEALGKVTASCSGIDICHDACASSTTFVCDFGRCMVDCPSGQIRNFPDDQCRVAPSNDRDGDGFLNNVDACPDQYAPAFTGSTNGCPVTVCNDPPCTPTGGDPLKWLKDILNDPTAQIMIVALIIIIAIVAVIKRRSSY